MQCSLKVLLYASCIVAHQTCLHDSISSLIVFQQATCCRGVQLVSQVTVNSLTRTVQEKAIRHCCTVTDLSYFSLCNQTMLCVRLYRMSTGCISVYTVCEGNQHAEQLYAVCSCHFPAHCTLQPSTSASTPAPGTAKTSLFCCSTSRSKLSASSHPVKEVSTSCFALPPATGCHPSSTCMHSRMSALLVSLLQDRCTIQTATQLFRPLPFMLCR